MVLEDIVVFHYKHSGVADKVCSLNVSLTPMSMPTYSTLKTMVSLGISVCLFSGTLVACTPKPALADPTAKAFLADLADSNFSAAGARTDNSEKVSSVLESSWKGLQAERLRAEITSVDTKDTIATAKYTMTWDLPRDRTFSYETSMTLNRINGEWKIRWQPSALHPRLGANQHLELRAINAERASVVSSDGAEILVPGIKYRLLIDATSVTDKDTVARTVAAHLQSARSHDETIPEIKANELADNLKAAKGRYSVALLSQQTGEALQGQLIGINGVTLNKEAALVNKDPRFAPDIIKRVSNIVDSQLEGDNGWTVSSVTADGAALENIEYHAPKVAPAVKISIDQKVQQAAESAVNLRKDMKTMIVAIRPSSGEILAVAQTPKADEEGDLALNGQFPPGSTFKVVTASAGIQDQGLNSGSIVPCPGTMNIYGRTVTNYNAFSLGNVPLQKAFARSCNTTFANISEQLAQGHLKHIGSQFGIGVDYDIPGLNTLTGSIPEGETPLDRTEAGYGQGKVLVSPFGMALMSATAASGKTPTPTLISGRETKMDKHPEALRPETIDQLRSLMGAVTKPGGTAAGMSASGEIFGKTGEAEINGGSHAWFTGYRGDLAFATLVVLGGGSEASVAITDNFLRNLDELNAH